MSQVERGFGTIAGAPDVSAPVRFRFAEFVLSPRQRLLVRNGVPVPLIPKYFDLLHLLVVRRRDAVSKQAIFTQIWSDVVVSDGALSQAIRTLRRTLDDDSREPRFIRTVPRHGYQFVWAGVEEEADEGELSAKRPPQPDPAGRGHGTIESLGDRLLELASSRASEEDARDLAEQLHGLGTSDALAYLTARPRHAAAVAMMRDARWSVAGAGDVPLIADAEWLQAIGALVRLRLSTVRRTIALRWAGASAAGAAGGAAAGLFGGFALFLSPTSRAPLESSLALAALGALAGGAGAAGVAAGLASAEVLARSRRGLALAVCGAAGGGLVATAAHLLLRALLDGLFGLRLPIGGGPVDGLVLGGAAGVGYAWTTRQPAGGGLAAPTGRRRAIVVTAVAACCAVAAIGLSLLGRPLVGGIVHEIARASRDAPLVLAPLGYLIGDSGFGPATRTLLSAFEGGAFGGALALGLTRRPVPDPRPAS
jgi:DNA-binding winged helix-turn-helix (wHTH) protein